MSEALGLSIGVDNLVAVRAGGVPVSRKAVLTLFDQRASEVGQAEQNPGRAGLVIGGFVERVGDRAPLMAGDGKRHSGAALTVEALEAMARTAGYGTPIVIAVPAYWSDGQTAALRNELLAKRGLISGGAPPLLVSDAEAAASALSTRPGFPDRGVIALCDFGAGGTTLTLLAPGSTLRQVGQPVRDTGFSGNEIDHMIADHLQRKARNARTVSLKDAVRSGPPELAPRDARRVKEQLSTANSTTVAMGPGADIFLSRGDFEQLISTSLDRFIDSIEKALQRNRIPRTDLSAVAIVGGGASIPLLTARLSERLRAPVLTTPQPAFAAAVGAGVLARQQTPPRIAAGPEAKAPTEMLSAPPTAAATTPPTSAHMPPTMASTPPTMASTPPTMASTPPTQASTPPTQASPPPTRPSAASVKGGDPPGTPGVPLTQTAPTASSGPQGGGFGGPSEYGALAWSEESGTGEEPVPYAGPEYAGDHADEAAQPPDHEEHHELPEVERRPAAKRARLPWYKRTALILTLAGAGAAILAALGLTLSLGHNKTGQEKTTTTTPSTTQTTTAAPSTTETTTEVPTTTTEAPETTETPTYNPPPVTTAPPRSNPPPTTTQKPSKSSPPPPSVTPSTTNKHGPLLPPFFPTPKH
jgi:hypothetical protein